MVTGGGHQYPRQHPSRSGADSHRNPAAPGSGGLLRACSRVCNVGNGTLACPFLMEREIVQCWVRVDISRRRVALDGIELVKRAKGP